MKADCSNDDPKMCEKKKGKWSKDKWTKKCLKNWGKKKCPHTCGYCRSSYGHLGYGGY
jgi:hypothetical protein